MAKWATLGGIGLGVAGFLTGNPSLVAAGATLATGSMGADAAKKASAQQVASTEKAQAEANALYGQTRDEQRRVFENSNAAFQPYIGLGHASLPNLGQMVGLDWQPGTTAPMQAAPMTVAEAAPSGKTGPAWQATPLPQTRAQMNQASGYEVQTGKRQGMGMGIGAMSGLVLVEAPDGSSRRFLPRAKADEALAAGAREVF